MGAHEQVPLHRAVAQLRECAEAPARDRHTVGAWEPLVGGVKWGDHRGSHPPKCSQEFHKLPASGAGLPGGGADPTLASQPPSPAVARR